ncbi:hypothetical protein [Streptomyces sp. NBC_01236]|uniref:hypothetical protein n=1 Tax=Streptomyces sp. NBC_01236 TaxID=2903789 RepID=UPI003FA3C055
MIICSDGHVFGDLIHVPGEVHRCLRLRLRRRTTRPHTPTGPVARDAWTTPWHSAAPRRTDGAWTSFSSGTDVVSDRFSPKLVQASDAPPPVLIGSPATAVSMPV